MTEYYIIHNKKKQGPYTLSELKKMNLKDTTLIWSKDIDKWVMAKNIEELKDYIIWSPPKLPLKIVVLSILHTSYNNLLIFFETMLYLFRKKSSLLLKKLTFALVNKVNRIIKNRKKGLKISLFSSIAVAAVVYLFFVFSSNGFKALYYQTKYKKDLISLISYTSRDIHVGDKYDKMKNDIYSLLDSRNNYTHKVIVVFERFYDVPIRTTYLLEGFNGINEYRVFDSLYPASIYVDILNFKVDLAFGFNSIYIAIQVFLYSFLLFIICYIFIS